MTLFTNSCATSKSLSSWCSSHFIFLLLFRKCELIKLTEERIRNWLNYCRIWSYPVYRVWSDDKFANNAIQRWLYASPRYANMLHKNKSAWNTNRLHTYIHAGCAVSPHEKQNEIQSAFIHFAAAYKRDVAQFSVCSIFVGVMRKQRVYTQCTVIHPHTPCTVHRADTRTHNSIQYKYNTWIYMRSLLTHHTPPPPAPHIVLIVFHN